MTQTNWIRGQLLYADDLDAAFGRCIDRAGDTMSGILGLVSDPVSPLDAATKQYVDNKIAMSGAQLVADNIAAAGTNQSGATPLVGTINIITSGATNSGVRLNGSFSPQRVLNRTGTVILVYPPGAQTIENGGASTAVVLA